MPQGGWVAVQPRLTLTRGMTEGGAQRNKALRNSATLHLGTHAHVQGNSHTHTPPRLDKHALFDWARTLTRLNSMNARSLAVALCGSV